jgi:Tol biopolymer transport system component
MASGLRQREHAVFDVWLVDVRTKAVTRVTRRNHSYSPSVSPDASKLAVRVEGIETCPDPYLGQYFMGKIRVFSPATGERETLAQFSFACSRIQPHSYLPLSRTGAELH